MVEPVTDLPKPRLGQPCNGCGLCCASSLCPAGKIAFGWRTKAPCPALRFKDRRTYCGLVLIEREMGAEPLIAEALGIGEGCTMDDRQ